MQDVLKWRTYKFPNRIFYVVNQYMYLDKSKESLLLFRLSLAINSYFLIGNKIVAKVQLSIFIFVIATKIMQFKSVT